MLCEDPGVTACWKAADCGGAVGAMGFGEGGGATPGFPPAGDADAGAEGAKDEAAWDPYFASIWAIAASSAFASRAMSLSGSGGRRLRSCSISALRART
jgi:hypothetical protein